MSNPAVDAEVGHVAERAGSPKAALCVVGPSRAAKRARWSWSSCIESRDAIITVAMMARPLECGSLVAFGEAYDARGYWALRRERLLNGTRAFARVVARRPIRTDPQDPAASALCAMPELQWHVVAAAAVTRRCGASIRDSVPGVWRNTAVFGSYCWCRMNRQRAQRSLDARRWLRSWRWGRRRPS